MRQFELMKITERDIYCRSVRIKICRYISTYLSIQINLIVFVSQCLEKVTMETILGQTNNTAGKCYVYVP